MRYAVPVLGDRVAPRNTCAEGVLLLTLKGGHLLYHEMVSRSISTPFDLIGILKDFHVDVLVCGGNNWETKGLLQALDIAVIDNVACSIAETVAALQRGSLHSGYGLLIRNSAGTDEKTTAGGDDAVLKTKQPAGETSLETVRTDCLDCAQPKCLEGDGCEVSTGSTAQVGSQVRRMLEAGADISLETERVLCRVSELVYFFLEMNYQKIGIAFCIELFNQTRILAGILKRFFDVLAICCKVGGSKAGLPELNPDFGTADLASVPCDALGQAQILNRYGSQINVLVGLCVGPDCVFTQASSAPVTTLFVKDRMLANNPIGAVYSDYYLEELFRNAPDFGID